MGSRQVAAVSAAMAFVCAFGGAAEAATIRAVAITGQTAPGAGGAVFSTFKSAPVINNNGEVAFVGELTGQGVINGEKTAFQNNNTGVFTSSALVARQADPAPGAGGANYLRFDGITLNGNGDVGIVASLAGPGATTGAFLGGAPLALPGDAVPGGGSATFRGILQLATADSGGFAVRAFVNDPASPFGFNIGVFTDGGPAAVAGAPAPGAGGATFLDVQDLSLNEAGDVAFTSILSDFTSSLHAAGSLVARTGDAAPGIPDAAFLGFRNVSLNDSGALAFFADLSGPGVDFTNITAFYASGAVVARMGEAIPGAVGATFGDFRGAAFANDGAVAFASQLEVGGSSPGSALFRRSAGGALEMILRAGDLIDIGGGDLRTLFALNVARGGLNDAGDIVFVARFEGGSGVFVFEGGSVTAAVPLPPALGLMLFGVAALGFAGRRRRAGA